MPRKEFILTNANGIGMQYLTLNWKGNYKNVVVAYNNQEIGVIANQKELKQGRIFRLPDNSSLSISLESGFFSGSKLNILHDGRPVEGAGNDPYQIWKSAYQIIYFVGGLSLLAGAAAELFAIEFLLNIGINIFVAIFGIMFLALGYMVSSEKSLTALYLAIILYVLDAISLIAFPIMNGGSPAIGGIVIHVLFTMQMVKGVPALQQIRAQESQQYPAY